MPAGEYLLGRHQRKPDNPKCTPQGVTHGSRQEEDTVEARGTGCRNLRIGHGIVGGGDDAAEINPARLGKVRLVLQLISRPGQRRPSQLDRPIAWGGGLEDGRGQRHDAYIIQTEEVVVVTESKLQGSDIGRGFDREDQVAPGEKVPCLVWLKMTFVEVELVFHRTTN